VKTKLLNLRSSHDIILTFREGGEGKHVNLSTLDTFSHVVWIKMLSLKLRVENIFENLLKENEIFENTNYSFNLE